MAKQPLKGVKVVDLSTYVAAASAGRLLADWGAEVIKVESLAGDVCRYIQGIAGPTNGADFDPGFQLFNANKRSLALDLKTEAGRAVMGRLLAQADVFLTNNRSKALRKLGLDYETLSSRYPRLIWAQVSGYGTEGPMADAPGFDTVAYWAMSGAMIDFTERDTSPMITPMGFGDQNTASTFAGAISAALFEQLNTGRGTKVMVSLLGQALWNSALAVTSVQFGSVYPKSRRDAPATRNTYQCADGGWLALDCPASSPAWGRFCADLGLDAQGDRIPDVARLTSIFLTRSGEEWEAVLTQADIPHALIGKISAIADHPQTRANHYIQEYHCRNGERVHEVTGPVQFDGPALTPRRQAPLLGEHTLEILRELGYGDAETDDLVREKIVKIRNEAP